MIKLTTRNGNPIWFAPEHITAVELVLKDDEQTWLYTTETDEPAIVTESPAEVARKVLEWRLAMIDYHHDIPSVKTKAMAELVRLAGLEEPNHDAG